MIFSTVSWAQNQELCHPVAQEYKTCNVTPAQIYQLREYQRCRNSTNNSDESRKFYCAKQSNQSLTNTIASLGGITSAAVIFSSKFGSAQGDLFIRQVLMRDFLEANKSELIKRLARKIRFEDMKTNQKLENVESWLKNNKTEISQLEQEMADLKAGATPLKKQDRDFLAKRIAALENTHESLLEAQTRVKAMLDKNLQPNKPYMIQKDGQWRDIANSSYDDLGNTSIATDYRDRANKQLDAYVKKAVEGTKMTPDEMMKAFIDPFDQKRVSAFNAFESNVRLMEYHRLQEDAEKKLAQAKATLSPEEFRKTQKAIDSETNDRIRISFPDNKELTTMRLQHGKYKSALMMMQRIPPNLSNEGKNLLSVHSEVQGLIAEKPSGVNAQFAAKFKIEIPTSVASEMGEVVPLGSKTGSLKTFRSMGIMMAAGAAFSIAGEIEGQRQMQWACDRAYPGSFTQYQGGSSAFNPAQCNFVPIDESPRSQRMLTSVLEEPVRWNALFQPGQSCIQFARLYQKSFCESKTGEKAPTKTLKIRGISEG
jgi:hypothetical protein